MSTQATTFERSEQVAEGTMAFHFAKPSGFQFRAGQAMDITLVDPPETDAEGNTRGFSIVSAPGESDLTIATRMRDTAFKRSLFLLKAGTAVQIDGPFGSLTLHKNTEKPAVFLAGGIGITPFISILRDAASKQLPHRLFLFSQGRGDQATAAPAVSFLCQPEAGGRAISGRTAIAAPEKSSFSCRADHVPYARFSAIVGGRDRSHHREHVEPVRGIAPRAGLLHCGPARNGDSAARHADRRRRG
jgi:hypothetical protein